MALTKHRGQNQLEVERASFILYFQVHHLRNSGQELNAVTWSQELMERPWWSDAYWLAHPGL